MPRTLDAKLAIIDEIERTMAASVLDGDECTMDERTLQVFCKLTEAQLMTVNAWLSSRVKALKKVLDSREEYP